MSAEDAYEALKLHRALKAFLTDGLKRSGTEIRWPSSEERLGKFREHYERVFALARDGKDAAFVVAAAVADLYMVEAQNLYGANDEYRVICMTVSLSLVDLKVIWEGLLRERRNQSSPGA
ncbi:MAG: hypothetical protein AABM33_15230 [Pseudomonadota bacterium]